jgi:hypothetical protein
MKRCVHLGNTEELYRFCPDEILWVESDSENKGMERTKVTLVNNNVYVIPQNLTGVCKCLGDATCDTSWKGTFLQSGRYYAVNLKYLNKVNDRSVELVYIKKNGDEEKKTLSLSKKACNELKVAGSLSAQELQDRQKDRHPEGYTKTCSSSDHFKSEGDDKFRFGGNLLIGYQIKMDDVYVPCERPESFYEIDDDDFLYLGI